MYSTIYIIYTCTCISNIAEYAIERAREEASVQVCIRQLDQTARRGVSACILACF